MCLLLTHPIFVNDLGRSMCRAPGIVGEMAKKMDKEGGCLCKAVG